METRKNPTVEQSKYLLELALPRSTFVMLNVLYTVTMITLGFWSLPLEVMIRYAFGERYLTTLKIWMSWVVLGIFAFFYSMIGVLAGGNPLMFLSYSGGLGTLFSSGSAGLLYHGFYYFFVGLTVWHRYQIWKHRHEPWLSTSFGISHLQRIPWNKITSRIPYVGQYIVVDDFTLMRFIEPGLLYLVGKAVGHLDGLLGMYIVVASIALLIKNNLAYAELRGRMLDVADAEIFVHYFAAALSGKPKEQTAGLSLVSVPEIIPYSDADLVTQQPFMFDSH